MDYNLDFTCLEEEKNKQTLMQLCVMETSFSYKIPDGEEEEIPLNT